MYRCTLCQFETEDKNKWAGHRSGHSRRGESVQAEYVCSTCERAFASNEALKNHTAFSHRRKPTVQWEELRGNKRRRQFILGECGHQCSECKLTEWREQPIPLELDHIDGNCENNSRDNLRLICPNCHAQTPTYRGKNIGKFVTKRSEYHKGRRFSACSLEAESAGSYTPDDHKSIAGSNPVGRASMEAK